LKSAELTAKLNSLYIRRTKEEVLKDALPMKDERIVFCEPSELQKSIYQHILEQPDFVLLR
jgi:SNF2 family DNA or RNA helicase